MLPTDKAPHANRWSSEEAGYFPTGNDTPGNHFTRTVLDGPQTKIWTRKSSPSELAVRPETHSK